MVLESYRKFQVMQALSAEIQLDKSRTAADL
jgi:hypothetical protein